MQPDSDRVSCPVEFSTLLSQLASPTERGMLHFRASAIVECFTVQEMDRFIAARDSLPSHLIGFIVQYAREEYSAKGARLFLTCDRRGGVALVNDELGSLFSLPGVGYGDMLVAFAVAQGASRLSCYDTRGKLPALYGRHGFKESLRAPWNDAYAPQTWS